MPVYEYRCSRGHNYEKTEGFDAPTRQRCPECNSVAKRQFSLPAVIFKGGGFYATDYRSKSYKDQKRKESGEPVKPKGESKDKGAKKESGSDS